MIREEQRVQAVAGKAGVTFAPGKGSHLHLHLNGRQSVLPIHGKELGKGLVAAIKKQLDLK